MLNLPSAPPQATSSDLAATRLALDGQGIPQKALDRNLLIATWNLRAFGGLTEKWESGPEDSPKRDLHALAVIAEVISHFDVVALQEVKGSIKALRHTLKMLGPEWGLILTDESGGDPGNDERLAFVFDSRRVKPSGLAAELVVYLDPDRRETLAPGMLDRQFARTPYAVSFLSSGQTFILVTLHVLWGEQSSDRIPELQGIAEWLADWAERTSDFNQNLIALGDFNIDRLGDPTYEAFTSTGLTPAPALNEVPRTIFDDPGEGHYYDQIAWFTEGGQRKLTLEPTGNAGGFDFRGHVLKDLDLNSLSWRISDHMPLWVEFAVPDTAIVG